MVVKLETVNLAQVARLIDAQDDGFHKAIEAPEHHLWRHLGEIPRPDGALRRLQQRVLTDALRAAKDQSVIEVLDMRLLHAPREPFDDVVGVVGIDLIDVIEPALSFEGVAGRDQRRPILIEHRVSLRRNRAAMRRSSGQ